MADFALDIQKFAESFDDGAEQAVRSTFIALSTSFVNTSPVDEGRFRANWFATGQQPSTKVTFNKDKDGSDTIKAITNVATSIEDWSVLTITNNLPYSEKIEFGGYGDGPLTSGGYSKKAPQGVVRINIKRFNQLLEKEARKALPK